MLNILKMLSYVLFVTTVTAVFYAAPAHAINSEFPSFGELVQKAQDAFQGVKDKIGSGHDNSYTTPQARATEGDNEKRKNRVGLLLILLGAGLLLVVFLGLRSGFEGVLLFIPGIIIILFLWWLLPMFPIFLLFIPLFGIRFLRQGGSPTGQYKPPAQYPAQPQQNYHVNQPSPPLCNPASPPQSGQGTSGWNQGLGRGKNRRGPSIWPNESGQDDDTDY